MPCPSRCYCIKCGTVEVECRCPRARWAGVRCESSHWERARMRRAGRRAAAGRHCRQCQPATAAAARSLSLRHAHQLEPHGLNCDERPTRATRPQPRDWVVLPDNPAWVSNTALLETGLTKQQQQRTAPTAGYCCVPAHYQQVLGGRQQPPATLSEVSIGWVQQQQQQRCERVRLAGVSSMRCCGRGRSETRHPPPAAFRTPRFVEAFL